MIVIGVALGLGIAGSAIAMVSDQACRNLYIQDNDNNALVENCHTFSSDYSGGKFNADSSTCKPDNPLSTGEQCGAIYKPEHEGIITCDVNSQYRDADGNPIHIAHLEIYQKDKGTLVNFYPWDKNTEVETGYTIISNSQGGFYNPSRTDTIAIQAT